MLLKFFIVFWLKCVPLRRSVVLSILRFFFAIRVIAIESKNNPKDANSFPWHVFLDPTKAKADVTALKPNSKVFVLLGNNKQGPSLRQSVVMMYHGTSFQALKEIPSVPDQPARLTESVPIHPRTVKGARYPLWGVYVASWFDTAEGYCFKEGAQPLGAILHVEVPAPDQQYIPQE